MDTSSNTNQRLPTLSLPGLYPYNEFEQFRDGSWKRQIVYPGKESYARGHLSGSWYEHDINGAKKDHSVTNRWEYTKQGKTITVETNHDKKIGGSDVGYITQDEYSEHGQDWMKAISGSTIHASGGTNFTHATRGTQVASTGDHVTDHNDGNHHINIEGDHIQFTGNNKYEFIGGEHGVFVSNGNMDTNVDKKLNFQSKQEFTINSVSSVTITVGKASITVNTNSIFIIDSNQNQVEMTQNGLYLQNSPGGDVFLGGNTSTSGGSWLNVLLVGGIPAPHVFGNQS